MNKIPWIAKIESSGGIGSGFRIDEYRVMTCAHILDGDSSAVVTINGDDFVDATASPSDVDYENDVAVLRLSRRAPVDIDVTFAPLSLLDFDFHPLTALGFPQHYEDDGISARITPVMGGSVEGILQFQPASSKDQLVRLGFSGAAAFSNNYRIVGMIIQSTRDGSSRMITAERLAEIYPPLRRLISLRHLPSAEAYWELRRISSSADAGNLWPHLEDLIQRNGLHPGAGPLNLTVASAVEYLTERGWEDVDFQRLMHEFLTEVARTIPGISSSLSAWLRRYFPSAQPVVADHHGLATGLAAEPQTELSVPGPPAIKDKGTITVRIEPQVDLRYTVEIIQTNADRERIATFLFDDIDPDLGAIEKCVVSTFEDAIFGNGRTFDELYGLKSYLIQFAVPPQWLTKPFETWTSKHSENVPIGQIHPVVVCDVIVPDFDETRWAQLRAMDPLEMTWRACTDRPGPGPFRAAILAADALAVGIGGPDADALVNTATRLSPVKVCVWSRDTCTAAEHTLEPDPCPGSVFSRDVHLELARTPVDRLPWAIRRITLASESGNWLGGRPAMYWENPFRRPDNPAFGVAVGAQQ